MTHASRFSLLLVLLAGLMGLAAPAQAQTFVIYVDKDATGANDGSSWQDAYTDLQTAIENAFFSDVLWVAEGVYTPDSEGSSFTITGNKNGIEIYGGFDGTESRFFQRAPRQHRTILSGDRNGDDTDPDGDGIIEDADPNQDGTPENLNGGENANHVLVLDGGGDTFGADVSANITSSTVLDGLVVTAGHADGSAYFGGTGGGLFCDGRGRGNACNPKLRNVVFAGNAVADNGGAIYNGGVDGTASPSIMNATFTGNSAENVGGAIFNKGFSDGVSSPSITNATFIGNAAGDEGGAIYNDGSSSGTASPQITNATFTGNAAGFGGGAISNIGTESGTSSPRIRNTILWGNTADFGAEMKNEKTLNDPPVLIHTIIEGGVNGSGVSGTSNTDGDDNFARDPQFADASDPDGPDGVFATHDDGLNVIDSSPALDAGDNAEIPSGVTEDITGADRTQDRDGDGFSDVNIGAYEVSTVVDVAITGGGFGGLDRTFSATPGQVDQPVGVIRLTPGQSGVDLTEVSVTPDNPGVEGVDQVRLWISDDDAFSPADDRKLASTDLDPQTDLPSPMTFSNLTEGLPGSARTLFVTVTLTSNASGEVTGYLADETAVSMSGGTITEVNGNAGQDQFSNLPLSKSASALPVEMASFEGRATEGGVRLRWKTASEQNNAGFRVERRARERGGVGERGQVGAGAWIKVGFVEGSGTTSEARSYRFADEDLPYAADTVAYRLKQVDTDGSTALTDPVTIARSGPNGLELLGTAPNPVRHRATIRYAIPEGTDGNVTIRLYDVLGRQVRTLSADAAPGRHDRTLDVDGLSSGVYVVRLTAGGQTKTRKLTVVQ